MLHVSEFLFFKYFTWIFPFLKMCIIHDEGYESSVLYCARLLSQSWLGIRSLEILQWSEVTPVRVFIHRNIVEEHKWSKGTFKPGEYDSGQNISSESQSWLCGPRFCI